MMLMIGNIVKMNVLIFGLLTLIALSVNAYTLTDKPQYEIKYAPQIFLNFVQDYHKYYKDNLDLLVHYETFRNNLIKINKMNSQTSATYGINEFSDQPFEELGPFVE